MNASTTTTQPATKRLLPYGARKHIRRQKALLRNAHFTQEQRQEKIDELYKKFVKPEPKPKKSKQAKQDKSTDTAPKQAKPENKEIKNKQKATALKPTPTDKKNTKQPTRQPAKTSQTAQKTQPQKVVKQEKSKPKSQ